MLRKIIVLAALLACAGNVVVAKHQAREQEPRLGAAAD